MSASRIECSETLFLKRRKSPDNTSRNKLRSRTQSAICPISAPATPLKASKSPTNMNTVVVNSQKHSRKSRSSSPAQEKTRTFSASPVMVPRCISSDLYDDPIDLSVPSMTNLPSVSAFETSTTPSCESFPPLPPNMVHYDSIVNVSPTKEPEVATMSVIETDLPPVPEGIFIMAVDN